MVSKIPYGISSVRIVHLPNSLARIQPDHNSKMAAKNIIANANHTLNSDRGSDRLEIFGSLSRHSVPSRQNSLTTCKQPW